MNLSPIAIFAIFLIHSEYANAQDEEVEWGEFKKQFGKKYKDTSEENSRRKLWRENNNKIKKHDSKVGYTLRMYDFADLSDAEFNKLYNGFKRPKLLGRSSHRTVAVYNRKLRQLPQSVDWRASGYVSSVKKQGECGSCWTFSAAGALEAQWYKNYKKLYNISAQNLLDCANATYGSYGCAGGFGWMQSAYDYILDPKVKGIMADLAYPYVEAQKSCLFDKNKRVANITGYVFIKANDEIALQNALVKIGPIAVAVDAHRLALYSSGIYADASCNPNYINHAVLAVGFGSDGPGKDYYIIKNSWGANWGENGYFRLARNKNNTCGIASYAIYPTVI